jgi:hypothetical protein
MKRGAVRKRWEFHLRSQDHVRMPSGASSMTANHLCAWRRDLAMLIPYVPRLGYMDDCFWYRGLIATGLPRVEHHIARVLYHYWYVNTLTANQSANRVAETHNWARDGIDYYQLADGRYAITCDSRAVRQKQKTWHVWTAGGNVATVEPQSLPQPFYTIAFPAKDKPVEYTKGNGMRSPGQRGVIQIDITNRCDVLKCSNCTRNLMHHDKRFAMTRDNFTRAVTSLQDYHGVIGIFGGNPCLHPQFEELSRLFAELIPDKRRRGLWSNNIMGHGQVIREVYGYFNLNVHRSVAAADEVRRDLPGVAIWGEDREAWHSPVLVAIKDMVGKEGGPANDKAMWDAIRGCDINLRWSGAITQHPNGNLRAYFCEIAAGFEHMYPHEDTGLEVTPGWWRRPIEDYDAQIRRWCPSCGVPLRMKGHPDLEFTDDVSETHAGRIKPNRQHVVHVTVNGEKTHEATDYVHLRKGKP